MDKSISIISKGFLIRLIVMITIYYLDVIYPKIRVSILFLLDALDCGYTQMINYTEMGAFGVSYCNEKHYIIGDEILDMVSYVMAYKLLGLNKLYIIVAGLRVVATIAYLLTNNKMWFLLGPDVFKELVMYSWFYPLNSTNIAVIVAIKMIAEYYWL